MGLSAADMIVSLLAGYLCGTIPFGLLFSRWAGLGDIRSIGSGNIGATNVLRTGNRKVAALTLLCDALKGHLFPLWLGFKGGKGVATSIGVLFGLYWPLGVIFIAVWGVVAGLSRISSLSALTASVVSPLAAWFLGRSDLVLPAAIMGCAVFLTHRANIRRLLNGDEPRIGKSKAA